MARSKLGARNSFAWMNLSGGAWPSSKILATSSPTRMRGTRAHGSMTERWSPAKTPDLAKRGSKHGSLNPQGKRRVPTRLAARVDCDRRCDERETDDSAPHRNGRPGFARELQSPSPVFPHSA